MKNKFNKIPLELQSKVVAVTGTLPGVGKSYTMKKWAEQLKAYGYQVIITGSTNKASHKNKTIYSVADWADISACKREKKFVQKEGKVYSQRSAVIMVDEAWMLDQEQIDKIKKQFPKCLIILFGDPCQFTPIESKEMVKYFRDEYTKDQYNPFTSQILQLIDKGLARNPIRDLDYVFNLKVQHRVKTPQLESFLNNVKSGFIAPVEVLNFIGSHLWKDEEIDFAICRTWEGKSGVYSYANYTFDNNKRVFGSLKEKVRGVYVGQNNYPKLGIYKNSLFNTKGESYEEDTTISSFDECKLQGAVTCHSIQGTTLNKGTKVVIDLDDAMSIIPEWKEENRKVYEDFARFVYIASSRVQGEDDVFFKCENKDRLLQVISQGVGISTNPALESKMDNTYIDSSLLSKLQLIPFLLSLKFKKREEAKASKFQYFLQIFQDFSKLGYNRYYNRLTWKNLKKKEKAAALHIGLNTMYKYKEDFKAAEEYFFSHETKEEQVDNSQTTGRKIKEIVGEMYISNEKSQKSYAYNLLEQYKEQHGENKTYKSVKEYIDEKVEWSEFRTNLVEDFLRY